MTITSHTQEASESLEMSALLKFYMGKVQAKLASAGTPEKKPYRSRKSRREQVPEVS